MIKIIVLDESFMKMNISVFQLDYTLHNQMCMICVLCRMTTACHKKCVPPHYKEAELSKGEAVCLDRCVAKYLDLHERLGRKLTELSVQDEEVMRKTAAGTG